MQGRVFGRYRINAKLAEGGMGAVYAATHELMQQREAVVKVLLPDMSAKTDMVKRFFHEAQAAASIHHPGIVEVFDFGYDEDGRAYIVMERLYGETLNKRLKQSRTLPEQQAVTLIRQLAGAVGAAHDRSIVHRDLKPDNIFIVSDPEVPGGERIKVLDFGLAKLAVNNKGSLITMSGTIFGTPAYMAPEQCYDAATVDHRADIYAIGCILYKLVCGRPPFGAGGIEVLAAQLRDAPRPPSELNPAVSPAIETVILKLLAKQPDARYQSCAELIRALDNTNVRMATADPHSPTLRTSLQAIAQTPLPQRPQPRRDDAAAEKPRQKTRTLAVPALPRPGSTEAPIQESETRSSLSASVGQVFDPPSTGRASVKRKSVLVAAAAVAVAGVAVLALVAFNGNRQEPALQTSAAGALDDDGQPDDPTLLAQFDAQLAQAQTAMDSQEWSTALATLSRASGLEIKDAERRTRSAELVHRAQSELGNQNTFERFRTAVATNDLEAIVKYYSKLPDTSVYRTMATPAFTRIRESWLDSAFASAQDLAFDDECEQLDALLADIKRLFPGGVAEFQDIADGCGKTPQTVSSKTPDEPAEKRLEKKARRPHKDENEPEQAEAEQTLEKLAEATLLVEQATQAYVGGQFGKAHRLCKEALQLVPGELQAATICGFVACNFKQVDEAKRYHKMLPAFRQKSIEQTCMKQGITLVEPKAAPAEDTPAPAGAAQDTKTRSLPEAPADKAKAQPAPAAVESPKQRAPVRARTGGGKANWPAGACPESSCPRQGT